MDVKWPLPYETDTASMLALLPANARGMMQGDGTLNYIRSGQAHVLHGSVFVYKLAHGGDQRAPIEYEAGLFSLFAEHDLAGKADADIPTIYQTLTNDDGQTIGFIRSKVAGQEPAKASPGKYPGHEALGEAAARLQAGLLQIGNDARHDPRLTQLPHVRPRTKVEQLNHYGETLAREDAGIAAQIDWARDILADRAPRTQGEAAILCEGDLHPRNMLYDEDTARIGFMDFGRTVWASAPEMGFAKLAITPAICKAAVEHFEGISGRNLDRDLIVAIAVADEVADHGYPTPNPRQDVMDSMRKRLGWLADAQALFNTDNAGDTPKPQLPGRAQQLKF